MREVKRFPEWTVKLGVELKHAAFAPHKAAAAVHAIDIVKCATL